MFFLLFMFMVEDFFLCAQIIRTPSIISDAIVSQHRFPNRDRTLGANKTIRSAINFVIIMLHIN